MTRESQHRAWPQLPTSSGDAHRGRAQPSPAAVQAGCHLPVAKVSSEGPRSPVAAWSRWSTCSSATARRSRSSCPKTWGRSRWSVTGTAGTRSRTRCGAGRTAHVVGPAPGGCACVPVPGRGGPMVRRARRRPRGQRLRRDPFGGRGRLIPAFTAPGRSSPRSPTTRDRRGPRLGAHQQHPSAGPRTAAARGVGRLARRPHPRRPEQLTHLGGACANASHPAVSLGRWPKFRA